MFLLIYMENIKTRDELSKYINNNVNKHIIIKVGATWCDPCKKMKPVFNNLLCELIKKRGDTDIIYLEIDIDKDKDCCNYLRVRGVPHIIYFNNGEINQNLVGFNSNKLCKLFSYIDIKMGLTSKNDSNEY